MIDKKIEILKSAKEVFSKKGYKDTNIAEITKNAGMATGTFYIYYKSKDVLFMDIYLEENKKLKNSILETVDLEGNPADVIKEIMTLNLQGMYTNPILKEWYNRDVFSRIEQSFLKENGLEQVNFLYDTFIEVVKKWQENGKMRSDIDADMIMAIFGSLINIDLHKDEIGLKYFPKVMEYIAEFIMKGLTDPHN